jgi:alanyl-tRNA synthetase
MLSSEEIRRIFIDFYAERSHTEIAGASLVPAGDNSVLFTSAGMQPLVPHFDGVPHPAGTRLVNVQRCLRTVDIDEVGDDTHLTLFEMLGAWSLGDYYKHEAIGWSLELLTRRLGFGADRLCATVFAGDADVPFDVEAYERWTGLGLRPERIHSYGRGENWWGPPGPTGPCGPDSEIFHPSAAASPSDGGPADDHRWVEIWNNVFIEYRLDDAGVLTPLAQRNVDTGVGLERLTCVLQGVDSVYDTDLLRPIIDAVRQLAGVQDERAERILTDHTRAAVMLIADGVLPSNTDRGYVLRRLIRRAIRQADRLAISGEFFGQLAASVIDRLGSVHPHLPGHEDQIDTVLLEEEQRFGGALTRGLREVERLAVAGGDVDGNELFRLFETHGLPPEQTVEELRGHGIDVLDWEPGFEHARGEHRDRSRHGAARRFAGGLSDPRSERVVRMHTATHLLGAALRQVLGRHVHQRGSNITEERLRFDFSHDRRLTEAELRQVEQIIREQIAAAHPVLRLEMPQEEASRLGAEREFGSVYPEVVSVYVIDEFSKEFCAGPHVADTRQVGHFRILKQESAGAGVRRIRATVE